MQFDVEIICSMWVRVVLSHATFTPIEIFALNANFPGEITKRRVILRMGY
jgi:hypothetical protein